MEVFVRSLNKGLATKFASKIHLCNYTENLAVSKSNYFRGWLHFKELTKVFSVSLTLNNAKSALISLLDGCDELVAIDDIDNDDVSSSSILRQKSSSFVGLDVLVVADNTGEWKEAETMEN